MATVSFENVLKIYDDASGGVVAVEDLNLDVEDGEFLVMVGPSGSGKSTSLRMLAGLESISDGEIWIGDDIVNEMPPRKRDVALVFQSNALYPHKTVRGNMAYGLKLRTNLSDEEINRRVEDAAEMMGIEDLLDKKPGALSGGQQQRVATGRAIVREPAVFLFDEPLSDLDANLRKHMRTELARIHSELEITTIYVTHDQEEAMTLADRIAVLNHGELQQVGRPTELYHDPANLFVADFIGSPNINLFEVSLERRGSRNVLTNGAFEYEVSESFVSDISDRADHSSLVLGVRPENIEIDDGGEIEATVDVVETVGSDNFLYVDVGGQECRARTSSTLIPEEDETLRLTFEEDDVYLFGEETEESVLDRTTRYRSKHAKTVE